MSLLQATVRCGLTALFLGFCLQLVIGQDDENRKPLVLKISPIPSAKRNELWELRCNVSTEARECVPMLIYPGTTSSTNCAYKAYSYKACICPGDRARNFYWDICSQNDVYVYCEATTILENGICENGYVPVTRYVVKENQTYIAND
ncbi:prolactin-inducible protein homolog [Sarcophilus harrisii]|uniref:prolactin-inducible protein homolog n=1 Tax=Sarcophilus harrisii TaxID=9305 RepID=UPI000226D100|nr:prolactin-inducible protein homolog [Sarcophilus harrisii]